MLAWDDRRQEVFTNHLERRWQEISLFRSCKGFLVVFALRNSDISTLRHCNWAYETSAGGSSTFPFHGEVSHRPAELNRVEHGYVLSSPRRMLSIATILEHSWEPHARKYQKSSLGTEANSTVLGTLNGMAGYHSWQRVTQTYLHVLQTPYSCRMTTSSLVDFLWSPAVEGWRTDLLDRCKTVTAYAGTKWLIRIFWDVTVLSSTFSPLKHMQKYS